MVQMPGVPVATVALNGVKNAELLAVQILGVADDELRSKFKRFKGEMADRVKETSKELTEPGYRYYLAKHFD